MYSAVLLCVHVDIYVCVRMIGNGENGKLVRSQISTYIGQSWYDIYAVELIALSRRGILGTGLVYGGNERVTN